MPRKKKGSPWRISTELLLRLNGNTRRGKHVNRAIDEHLRQFELVCRPTLENADYYGSVVVSDPRDELTTSETVVSLPISALAGPEPHLMYCGPEMAAKKVQTLMIAHDVSQIPVLYNDKKTIYGVVTWQSIAQFRGDLSVAYATDLMRPSSGHIASSSDDFLELSPTVVKQEFMLYRVPDDTIGGILTASDLAEAFQSATGIYIQLQEIETRLRILLDRSPIPEPAKAPRSETD